MKLRVAMVCLALAFVASAALAQVVTTGTIVVIVQDEQGGRLPGATVSASAADSITSREAVTNEAGEATLQAVNPSAQYVVTVDLPGFAPARFENILVRSGHTATIRATMSISGIQETVTVTSETPLVDTKSSITGQDITLELTESLPTGRSYQSYLQLVPGVLPDDPENEGNPASKSGLNYRDVGGDVGVSRDNFYYIDGINVTDTATGEYGANLNTEVIQEQKVLTGGIPAEYIGTPGLLSNVILKSGTNTFHGSANYFFQNDALVAEDKNAAEQGFSTYDTAFTLGGPIIMDKAWFFGSYRYLHRNQDVASLDTEEFLRTIERKEHQGYVRGTVSPTSNDTFSFTFLNDPLDRFGSPDRDRSNQRDYDQKRGGNRFNVSYARMFGMNFLMDATYNQHEGELSNFASLRESANDQIFRSTDDRTQDQEQLGGFGSDNITTRDTKTFAVSANYNMTDHVIKGGFEYGENRYFRNDLTVGNASFNSLAPHLAGITAREFTEGSFSDSSWRWDNASDFNGFVAEIDRLPNRDQYYAHYDTNRNGVIEPDEVADNMVWDSTDGNPNGIVNYNRTAQVQDGPQDYHAEAISWYIQDTFTFKEKWVFNIGLRAEHYDHFASDNQTKIYTFPWTWAPRLSVIYDIKGDGTQKVSAYWGKYFDPIRNNMTNFAGQLSGRIRHEQIWGGLGEWVTYRIRGGAQSPDAYFAPTTLTPWTDDLMVGYETQLGQNMSFEALYTKRRTRDVLEDYDMSIYTFRDDGTTSYPGPIDHPDSLFLGLDYYGYSSFPESNFVIATLAGGKRDYQGLEFVFRKRYSDNWQAYGSYTYNHATGNTNSDSNADFQGDVLYLDPRAPNQLGDQPGSIRHLFKFGGTYMLDMGLEFGGNVFWNSGTLASLTNRQYGRNLPNQVPADEAFEFAGFVDRWLAPDSVGTLTNPSWGQLNVRVQYHINRGGRVGGQVFLDIFNLTDSQPSIRNQDITAGVGGTAFGEGIKFNPPRRFYIGARLIF